MNNNTLPVFKAPRTRLPSPAQVLAKHRDSTIAGGREPTFNTGDEVRQVYAAVQQEALALTEDQARAYGRVLFTMHKEIVEEKSRIGRLQNEEKAQGKLWARQTKFSMDFWPGEKQQEYADLKEILVRAMMPIIGLCAFQNAERFGGLGIAFSAAYREATLGVVNYDPGIGKRGLSTFIKGRLAKRMTAHLMEEEGSRKHAELADLMAKYLTAMNREIYVAHDPQQVYAELVELFGGFIDEDQTIPCEAFVKQSLNSKERIIEALAAVEFSNPLSLDYNVDAARDTLADTIYDDKSDPEIIEKQHQMEDLTNNMVWLEQLGYSLAFQDETRHILNDLLAQAWASDDVASVIDSVALHANLEPGYVKDLLVVWGPFYKKYLPLPETESENATKTHNSSATATAA